MEQLGQGTQQNAPQAPQSLPSYQVPLTCMMAGEQGRSYAYRYMGPSCTLN